MEKKFRSNDERLFPVYNSEAASWDTFDWEEFSDKEIISLVTDRFTYAQTKKEPLTKEWKENIAYFLGQYDDIKGYDFETMSVLKEEVMVATGRKVMKTMSIMSLMEETISRQYNVMFKTQPFMIVQPIVPKTKAEEALGFQSLFHEQIRNTGEKTKFTEWIFWRNIIGTGIMKPGYEISIKKRFVRKASEQEPSGYENLYVPQKSKRFVLDIPNPFFVFPDPDAKSQEDISYVVEKQYRRLSRLLASDDIYGNLGELKERIKNSKLKNADKKSVESLIAGVQKEEHAIDEAREGGIESDSYDPIVELLVYYERNRIIVVANEDVLIRNDENPFEYKEIPFIFSPLYFRMNTYWGMAEVSFMKEMSESKDILLRQVLDYNKQAIGRKVGIRKNSGIDIDDVKDPNTHFFTFETPDDIKELTLSSLNTNNIMGLMQYLDGELSGISGNAAFEQATKQRVATGVYAAQQEGANKIMHKIDIAEESLQKLCEFVRNYNYQYIEMGDYIKVKDKKTNQESYWPVIPEALENPFSYEFVGSGSAENRDLLFGNARILYQLFAGKTEVNQQALIKNVITFSGMKNIEELLAGLEPQEIMDEAALANQGLIEQGGTAPVEQGDQQEQDLSGISSQEMMRRQISSNANPRNDMNGGVK